MGFRFRQGLRVFPGLRLNLSKSGISASLGGRGATLNVSRKGIRGTVGVPGSGLSYSDMMYRVDRSGSNPFTNRPELQEQPEHDRCGPANFSLTDQKEAELYLLTVHLVMESGKASASWLQRQLGVGYSTAAKLIERMEGDGVVSSADRVGRRKVLVEVAELPELPDDKPSA